MIVSVIGLGLIGSSAARGLRAAGVTVHGYSSGKETREKAVALGVVDVAAKDYASAVKEADIVLLAVPLRAYSDVAAKALPHMKPGAVITDAGSVKTAPIFMVAKHISKKKPISFVPAHPIAGSEKSGIEAGNAELFREKKVVITPLPGTPDEDVAKVTKMWETLGAKVSAMTASEHDRIYAAVSHVPQFLSYAYMLAVTDKRHKQGAASDDEFMKFIRLAGSDPLIWADIFMLNKRHIFALLEKLFALLQKIGSFTEAPAAWEKKPGILAPEHIFPVLLGNSYLSLLKKQDLEYAGTGLASFCRFAGSEIPASAAALKEEIGLLAALLHRKIFEITATIESESRDLVEGKLADAKNRYESLQKSLS